MCVVCVKIRVYKRNNLIRSICLFIGEYMYTSNDIAVEVGKKIRFFRKKRKITIEELSKLISKSKATVAKYESAEIIVDIVTLFDIANALSIRVEQLLSIPRSGGDDDFSYSDSSVPAFFKNNSRFYTYSFDSSRNDYVNGVIDIISQENANSYQVMLYLSVKDLSKYQQCENTYTGFVGHHHALSQFHFTNQDSSAEQAILTIVNAFDDADYKIGMWGGIKSHPLMPCAAKLLLSKKPLQLDATLKEKLIINKDDLRMLKLYNLFVLP